MTLAMKKLKNFGWVALLSVIMVLLYPLSLNVGALHSELVNTDRKIMETKREISFLQAELRTRANMEQLAEWNDLLYGYDPPTAEQFLNGERALANLDGVGPDVKPVMVAVSASMALLRQEKLESPVPLHLNWMTTKATIRFKIAIATSTESRWSSKASRRRQFYRVAPSVCQKWTISCCPIILLKEIEKKAAQERKRR